MNGEFAYEDLDDDVSITESSTSQTAYSENLHGNKNENDFLAVDKIQDSPKEKLLVSDDHKNSKHNGSEDVSVGSLSSKSDGAGGRSDKNSFSKRFHSILLLEFLKISHDILLQNFTFYTVCIFIMVLAVCVLFLQVKSCEIREWGVLFFEYIFVRTLSLLSNLWVRQICVTVVRYQHVDLVNGYDYVIVVCLLLQDVSLFVLLVLQCMLSRNGTMVHNVMSFQIL